MFAQMASCGLQVAGQIDGDQLSSAAVDNFTCHDILHGAVQELAQPLTWLQVRFPSMCCFAMPHKQSVHTRLLASALFSQGFRWKAPSLALKLEVSMFPNACALLRANSQCRRLDWQSWPLSLYEMMLQGTDLLIRGSPNVCMACLSHGCCMHSGHSAQWPHAEL